MVRIDNQEVSGEMKYAAGTQGHTPETSIGADIDSGPEDVSQSVWQVEEKVLGAGLDR